MVAAPDSQRGASFPLAFCFFRTVFVAIPLLEICYGSFSFLLLPRRAIFLGGSPDSRVFVELPQRLVVVQPGHGLGDRGLVLGFGLHDSGMVEE